MKKRLSGTVISSKSKSNNREGSTTVIVMLIMATLITIAVAFVNFSKDKAEEGINTQMLSLSSRSVLSEYSVPLKDKYGIFGVDMTTGEIAEKMDYYISKNCKNTAKKVNVRIGKYKLTDTKNFEKAIVEYVKFIIAKDLLGNDKESVQRDDTRELKNEKIIKMLPSANTERFSLDTGAIVDAMDNIDNLFDRTKNKVLANEYILHMFNNHSEDSGETFFKNEVEYIITGKFEDGKNYSSVKSKLMVVRNLINLAVIYKTPELKSQVVAMAALTGIGTEIAIPIIAEAWALIEANNDIKILENGGKIPIVKNADTWATDIDGLLEGDGDGYIDNNSETGMDYRDYLNIFLYFLNDEEKYRRTMDLMQINIQGSEDETFAMETTSVGFECDIEIGNKRYRYDEKY